MKPLEDVVTQRVGQQLGALHLVDGVVQARGQQLDPLLGQLLGRQGEQVVVRLGRQRVVLCDAAQSTTARITTKAR